jgi:2-methylcitrate dehydratase PrpD
MLENKPVLTRRDLMACTGSASLLALLPRALRATEGTSGSQRTLLARRLADYVCNVRLQDFPAAAVERAKEHLLYHAGLAFTGALTADGRQVLDILKLFGPSGKRVCTVIGQPGKHGALEAAFANAAFMRALGFDDVMLPGVLHGGLLSYPVALAIAEQQRTSGEELLTAVLTGYELLDKMFLEQDKGRAPRRPGFPFSAFPGAAAAARLLKLSPEQTANAIGYAADGAMGLKAGDERQPTDYYGLVARTAITSALMAQAGGVTDPAILEGKYGFYATLIGYQPDADALIARLGTDPGILRTTQKRYPGSATNIVVIQLVMDIVEKEHLSAANVERVELDLAQFRKTFDESLLPGPYTTRAQAESALPFPIALILLDGRLDLSRYDDFNNPEVLAVARRVSMKIVPKSNPRYGRVRIITKDGRSFERAGDDYVFPPLDATAWLAKDGEKFVPRANLERFGAAVRRLETVKDTAEVTGLLAAPG